MSIIGGAVVPAIQGLVSDLLGSMQLSFLVNLLCFGAVLVFFGHLYRRGVAQDDAAPAEVR